MASVVKKSKVGDSGKSVAAAVTKVTDVERVLEKGVSVGSEGLTFAMWANVKEKQDATVGSKNYYI